MLSHTSLVYARAIQILLLKLRKICLLLAEIQEQACLVLKELEKILSLVTMWQCGSNQCRNVKAENHFVRPCVCSERIVYMYCAQIVNE